MHNNTITITISDTPSLTHHCHKSSNPRACVCVCVFQAIDRAEDFFVESLEQWRISMEIDSFALLGHSLGGYLSSLYALRYPHRVSNLILASPAGLPEPPAAALAYDSPKNRSDRSFSTRLFLKAWAKLVSQIAVAFTLPSQFTATTVILCVIS